MSIHSPAIAAAVAWLEGASFVGHLCSAEPHSLNDVARVSLGAGLVTKEGGEFTCSKPGWVECLAFNVNGTLVVTRPGYCPLFIRAGQHAKVGALTLDPDVERQ